MTALGAGQFVTPHAGLRHRVLTGPTNRVPAADTGTPPPGTGTSMARTARVALLGFNRLERATFEAFFRMAGTRTPAYAHEGDPRRAHFVIVDAGDAAACASARDIGAVPRAVALGEPTIPGVLLQLARPLNLMAVVRALDQVLAREGPYVAPRAPTGAALPRKRRRSRKPRELATTVRIGLETTQPGELRGTMQCESGHFERVESKSAALKLDHILVVDDSDDALRFMASQLQRFGFQIHLAQSAGEALARIAERHFEFVFLDMRVAGVDGLQLCKAIKRAEHAPGMKAPAVVLLSSRGAAIDRLRGTMAGADACLGKPLRELELLKLVGEREVTRHAFAETAVAETTR